jgi:hypothetical protein
MPQVLTSNATITCPHGGRGTTTPITNPPKWLVSGGAVLLEGDPGTLACPFPQVPCVGYQLRTMGLNATTVDGRQVILATDFNQTLTGLPLTMVETHQTSDDSSPAPLPAGGQAGPPPPELADTTPPTVVGLPTTLAFSTTTPTPTLAASFTLSASHPWKRVLTLLNGALKTSVDLTQAQPPGLTVLPPGDAWDTPQLTVTLLLTAAFMAALGPGEHHMFLTGVSRRGLPGVADLQLTVS